MCGITGYVDLNSPIDRKPLLGMLSCIKHRGPDDNGTYFDKHAALGIQRLSIIDLKGGHQPICNENKNIWVVFNGEIYNYIEIKKYLSKKHIFRTKTDTEVIVHLYEEYGENFPRYLNGMFAFAIWDKKKQQLFLGRDFAGVKPLYFYQKGSKLIFGSELKAILKYPQILRKINTQALDLYKFFGYVPQPFSIFENICKLGPGEILTFSKFGKKVSKFWDISSLNPTGKPNLDTLLKNSVKLQSRSDVPIGVFLSGGIDSSLITYYLSRIAKRNLKTFSISFDEQSFDESKYFNRVAKLLKTDHYFTKFGVDDAIKLFSPIVEKMDEPFADPSLFPTYKLSSLASQHVKVVLSGDGGDELFAGYPTYTAHIPARILKNIPSSINNSLIRILQKAPISYNNYPFTEKLSIFLSGLKLDLLNRHLLWMSFERSIQALSNFSSDNNRWLNLLSDQISDSKYSWQIKLQLLDFFTYLTDDLLVKVDRASMANSLEVRVPFLDPNIVNFAFSANKKHFNLFKTKIMLRKLLKDKLPKAISERGKKGFGLPISAWIQKPMKELIEAQIKNPDLYDYFDKKMVLKSFNKHINKKANYGKRLWLISVFSAWLRNYGK